MHMTIVLVYNRSRMQTMMRRTHPYHTELYLINTWQCEYKQNNGAGQGVEMLIVNSMKFSMCI